MFLVTLDSPKIFRSKASKAHSGRVHQAPASWASAACSGRHTVLPLPGHRGTAQCCARWNDTYSGWFQKKWGDFSKDLGANQEQDGIGVQNLADFAKKNQDHNRIMNDHAPTCPLFCFPTLQHFGRGWASDGSSGRPWSASARSDPFGCWGSRLHRADAFLVPSPHRVASAPQVPRPCWDLAHRPQWWKTHGVNPRSENDLHPRWVFHTELLVYPMNHWIGLRENLQETMVFTIKYRAFL